MALARALAAATALTLALGFGPPSCSSFEGLGVLTEAVDVPRSTAADVSDDGCTVVGRSVAERPIFRAVRWEGGDVTELPVEFGSSRALGVSGDGSVVVGLVGGGAARWEGGVLHPLGDLRGSVVASSVANDVSRDGSVIVGQAERADREQVAFRWEDGVMTGLGRLPGATGPSAASAVSADGSVVVGLSHSAEGNRAFRWEGGVMTNLGALAGSRFSFGSEAFGLSPDGSVVVGASDSADGIRAFRWEGGVLSELGEVPGEAFPALGATDASTDGSILVGCGIEFATGTRCDEAVVWDRDGEARLLESLLRDFGLGAELKGWTLWSASSVSPDATTIVGTGSSPEGREEAWIATSATGFDRPPPPWMAEASFAKGGRPPRLAAPHRCGRP